jgi:putative heme-binding domain-containing protein
VSLWMKNTSGDAEELLVKGVGVVPQNVAAITGTPPDIKPQAKPATVDEVLAAIPKADAKRGRLLVLHPAGAGCIACHHIGGRGNHFGPDLTGIGSRAELKHLVQSIIEPSAVITEGFNSQVISTAQGMQSGVLLEESGLAITLGLPTGQRARIMRADITKQETLPISAMPPLGALLTAQQCADIAAWLMTQKDAGQEAASVRAPRPDPAPEPAKELIISKEPVTAVNEKDRLIFMQGKDTIGEYVFADARVKRPFFSNMKAPGGLQVTRTFPPVEGVDAKDHAEMHPGIWLAFGDINGEDFWRNKATIRHDKFTQAPEIKDAALQFATQSTLLTKDGAKLGLLESEFRLRPASGTLTLMWAATVRATEVDLVFGDQEEMGFGVRVATPITEKNGGLILNSKQMQGAKQTWGQLANWCDYSGVVDGQPAGVLIMPMARQGSRPCWWHNRDYGVFVANEFGRKAMKQGDKLSTTVAQGKSLFLVFAAVLHSGQFTLPKPDRLDKK